MALAKDSATTGEAPRESDPAAKPLLDLVLDTSSLQSGPVQARLRRRMDAGRAGPDAAIRARTTSYIWGEVRDAAGRCVESRMRCANGYAFTARSAVAAARRVLAGEVQPGFRTPSLAFGAGFATSLGASIEDRQG